MLSFVVVDILSGSILADLKDLTFSGALKDTMGRAEQVTASLPLPSAPANWKQSTTPYTAAIICLADDGQQPLWGGIITNRKTSLGGLIVLSLSTVPEYFDRRYLGNEKFTARPQNLMIQDLVNKYARDTVNGQPGIPIRVQVEGTNGMARDKSFDDTGDKTLLSALQDISGLDGGPEWVVEWENVNQLITPVLRVANRLGTSAPAGLLPGVQFTAPGSVRDAEYEESYKGGDGANDVMATSSGAADARPQSQHWRDTTPGRPRIEFRWSPSTSTTLTSTLDSHASRALAALKDGMKTLTLTASRKKAQDLGSEWRIGDDVYVDLVSPAWSGGFTGVARVIGWDLTESTVSPILLINPTTVTWNL